MQLRIISMIQILYSWWFIFEYFLKGLIDRKDAVSLLGPKVFCEILTLAFENKRVKEGWQKEKYTSG